MQWKMLSRTPNNIQCNPQLANLNWTLAVLIKLKLSVNYILKQECIPVGCVPPVRYHTAGGLCLGVVSLTETPLERDQDPLWTDRHIWKHNLRKLRFRAVKKLVTFCAISGVWSLAKSRNLVDLTTVIQLWFADSCAKKRFQLKESSCKWMYSQTSSRLAPLCLLMWSTERSTSIAIGLRHCTPQSQRRPSCFTMCCRLSWSPPGSLLS